MAWCTLYIKLKLCCLSGYDKMRCGLIPLIIALRARRLSNVTFSATQAEGVSLREGPTLSVPCYNASKIGYLGRAHELYKP